MARKYNTLEDLNEMLFSILDGITSDDESESEKAAEQAKAAIPIAQTIISNATLRFQALKFATEYSSADPKVTSLIGKTDD